jgi:hypothetical protein
LAKFPVEDFVEKKKRVNPRGQHARRGYFHISAVDEGLDGIEAYLCGPAIP